MNFNSNNPTQFFEVEKIAKENNQVCYRYFYNVFTQSICATPYNFATYEQVASLLDLTKEAHSTFNSFYRRYGIWHIPQLDAEGNLIKSTPLAGCSDMEVPSIYVTPHRYPSYE